MFDAPHQLRNRTDLDGLHIRVSGKPRSWLDPFRGFGVQSALWILTAVFGLAALSGSVVSIILAGLCALTAFALDNLDPATGALETDIALTAGQLVVRQEGQEWPVPWTRVGLITARSGAKSGVIIRVMGEAPLVIPMELEPPEHAVWVAQAIEQRSKEMRKQQGTAADVPRGIRTLGAE